MSNLPTVFIGCSVDALPVARAINEVLDRDAHMQLWDHGTFNTTVPTLTDLIIAMGGADFGIFVFKPDDPIIFNKVELLAVRDNVIFETGLFIGGLGTKRVLILKPRSTKNLKIPTDLSGVTIEDYDDTRENIPSAVQAFCNVVRRRMQECGNRFNKKSDQYGFFEELHHVSLPVKDIERSRRFYTTVLGLKEIQRPVMFKFKGAWFGLPGGQQLHFVEKPGATYRTYSLVVNKTTPPDSHFALRVDFESYVALETNIALEGYLHIAQPFPGLRQLYVLDPDNHIIEITALTAPQRALVYL